MTAVARTMLRGLALPLAAMFVIAVGYGVVLPLLPFMLARFANEFTNDAIAWHTGLLTGVYTLALFVFAPVWGRMSDRLGRGRIVMFGLAGFAGAMLAFVWLPNIVLAYGARAFAGIFAAAVVPTVFAWAGDGRSPSERARAFAWLYAGSALGFLFGPALSGWLVSPVGAGGNALALPFYVVALLSGVLWFAVRRTPVARAPSGNGKAAPTAMPAMLGLLTLSLLVTFGLGSFEVGLALQGRQVSGLSPRELSWMFVECSLVMILMQLFVLPRLIGRLGATRMLVPGFLAMAGGVALLPYVTSYPAMLLAVALIAGAGGLLIPALAYLVSLNAGSQQGVAFGKQTAAVSLGQASGSVAAGGLFALSVGTMYWAAAGMLVLGAVVAISAPATSRPVPEG